MTNARDTQPDNLLKRLLTQTAHYLSAGAVTAALAYGTVAVLTRVLSTEDYGVFTVFQAIANFIAAIASINFQVAANRYRLEDTQDFPSFTRTTSSFLLLVNALLVGFTWLVKAPVGQLLNLDGQVLFFAVVVGALRVPWLMVWKILVAEMRSRRVTLVSSLRDLSIFLATVSGAWLLLDAGAALEGALVGVCVGSLLVGAPCTLWLMRTSAGGTFEWAHLRYALHFGLPLVPSAVATTALNLLDRVVILDALGPVETGIYSFAYNIGQVMNLAVLASAQAIGPIYIRLREQLEWESIEQAWRRVNAPLLALAIGLVLFAPEAAILLGDERYHAGLSIVPWVALGYLARAYGALFAQYSIYLNRTWVSSSGIIVAAVLNAALNIWLVPLYGIDAAAITTFGSFLFILAWNALAARFLLQERTVRLRVWLPSLLVATVALPALEYALRALEGHVVAQIAIKACGTLVAVTLLLLEVRRRR